ncbi:unnamed protein product [Peronospora destructor]|uniref:RBR-type E3 ubiquitin transferase n=1 Tax=Peronospora destructor TaxID=86335 RepID=A0AAV0UZI3_9STRA|nr:unnamed protein product [Peronospora destructor]
MKPTASTCNRAAHLAALYSSLQQLQTFSNEDERMRWCSRLDQLQRQQEVEQQETPEAWAAHIASLLTAIENQISALPLESEVHLSRNQAASAVAAICESRLIVEEDNDQRESELMPPRRGSIPMMENETIEDTRRGSCDQMPRLMRATTGLILRALTRFSIRERKRSLPLSRTRLNELDAAMRDEEASSDDLLVAVAASSQRVSIGVEELVERESVGLYRRQESNSLGRLVPSLLRSMANVLRFSMEETFLCQICYDYTPMNTSYALLACGHTFCVTCLKSYLECKVKEGQVYPTCFFEQLEDKITCKADILVDDIRSLVSKEVWQKYDKFKFNKEHELARQCPYCDHSQLYAGSDYPECTCEACSGDFCFVHSSAHQGRTCAEYDKKMIAVEKLNNALISKISKPCPSCQNNVEKTGGCNQMKCVVCSTSFCWICLKIIDDSVFPEHFQWWNVRGCAGNQMVDFEDLHKKALALHYECCSLAKSRLTFRQAFTTCFCASGYVLFAPVLLAVGLVALGVVIGGAAAGVAVLVCVSPVVGLMLLFRCDSWHSTFSWRSPSRCSDHVETATVGNVENANDQSPRDQTFLRV